MATAAVGSFSAGKAVPFRWLILLGLVTAAIMEVLDTTIVNVALPQMMGNLGATPDEIGWVATGYILSNVVVLPMTAWLSSRFGRKRYLTASILLFVAASFFCGTSHTLTELVFWRVLQGAGGAALLSTAQATLVEIFPQNQQGMVQALFGLGIIMAPTLAPALGGWITDNYTWPWVFFVNVPIGLASAFLVGNFLQDSKYTKNTASIDGAGIALLALGLSCLQYVLQEGKRYDWFDNAMITRLSLVAAACLIFFTYWELRRANKHPIVDLHVLKNRSLLAGISIGLVLGFGLYGGVFIFPLFVQNILHFTPTATGLVLMPGGLASGVAMIFCGRMLNKQGRTIDARGLIVTGMALFISSMWMLGHLTIFSGVDDTRIALIVRGFGLGFLFIPITVSAFSTLQGPDIAQGASLFNLARQLGGSFGIAVLNTYVDNQTAYHRTNLVTNTFTGNNIFNQRVDAVTHALHSQGLSANAAHSAALQAINGSIQAQAMTMSYNDAFLLLGLSFVVAFPAVLLLKRGRRPSAQVGGAH
ncbi:MAG TPA: DHA2 family efflux MFS transporter permease subunit [Capsulimonadaceae bacterium]|nr:DHA2 family efflux MFS transporter permease subunit [Capsulimonadaceae bacterium]